MSFARVGLILKRHIWDYIEGTQVCQTLAWLPLY